LMSGSRLRHLFAILLLYCKPASPDALWTEFRASICDDLRHRLDILGHTVSSEEDVFDYGL
ncbi:hypothetical protein C2E23DRAFT_714666, partial [Lenzites betulinus]